MADPISEGLGRAPSPAAAEASAPEVSGLDDGTWPESPEAGSGFTDNALADYLRRLNQFDLLPLPGLPEATSASSTGSSPKSNDS